MPLEVKFYEPFGYAQESLVEESDGAQAYLAVACVAGRSIISVDSDTPRNVA